MDRKTIQFVFTAYKTKYKIKAILVSVTVEAAIVSARINWPRLDIFLSFVPLSGG